MTEEAKFMLWIWFEWWAVVGKLVLKDQMDMKKAGCKVIANIKNQKPKTKSLLTHLLELFIGKAMKAIYMRSFNWHNLL